MPWQRFVADVGCEVDPSTGLPAYREVRVTIPRQSGKTTLFLAWQINRCISRRWSHPQRSAFTAQTGKDARDKWLDELFPMIRASKLYRLVEQINQGMGNEQIKFKTGSMIRLLSTSTTSGHSKTLHQAVMDEVWHDVDHRREQGLRPAMITVRDAQLLVCSTAGTDASVILNAKVARGREAVRKDSGHGVAYFEWSAPDGWDPEDEASYYTFMPALCPDPPCRCDPEGKWHHSITIEAIRAEREELDPPEFKRAYGNIKTSSLADRLIPAHLYDAVLDPSAAPSGEVSFGLDVNHDRSSASIGVSDGEVVEVVAHGPGTGWLVDWFHDKPHRRRIKVVVDGSGPAANIADDLEADGVKVRRMTSGEVASACGRIFDDIADGKIRIRTNSPELDRAVSGVATKVSGDRFRWSRSMSSEDVTPFFAVTLAYGDREAVVKPQIHGWPDELLEGV